MTVTFAFDFHFDLTLCTFCVLFLCMLLLMSLSVDVSVSVRRPVTGPRSFCPSTDDSQARPVCRNATGPSAVMVMVHLFLDLLAHAPLRHCCTRTQNPKSKSNTADRQHQLSPTLGTEYYTFHVGTHVAQEHFAFPKSE